MATDVIDRLNRRASTVLGPDELWLGAQPMTVRGAAGLSSLLEGGDADALLPDHVSRHGSIASLTVSDAAIPNAFLVAVTNERLVVFSRSIGGRPREHVASYPLGETILDVVDHGSRARRRTCVFTLASGEVFAGDTGINGPAGEAADRFVAAYREATA